MHSFPGQPVFTASRHQHEGRKENRGRLHRGGIMNDANEFTGADTIIVEAITAKLSDMFYLQISEQNVSPAAIAKALVIVAGNISSP